jgi:TolB-like protein/DNA-binding winged helix-turn-helix (wHTH) protein
MSIHFADFDFDPSRRELSRGSESVHLSPKAFQLLSILIEESPRAVSKTDLQERLWPDTFVSEGNLAGLVTELRSALGDDARETRFIRTLYGFGYSFAAPIAEAAAIGGVNGRVPSQPRRPARWTTASMGAVAGAVGIVTILSFTVTASAPVSPPAAIRSIAILPFDTSGSDRGDQHLGLGLSDLLITRLSNVHHLIVRPTSAIREFADRHIDARKAGRDLRVDAVLEGSIRTTPNRVRVTVQLLKVGDQKPMWAESFDQKRAEMFDIEDDISARVTDALMVRLTPAEKSLLAKRYTTDPDAYALYIAGRYQMKQGREERPFGRENALKLFQKAVEKDPHYALAWAGVAQAYAGMGAVNVTGISPRVAWTNAEAAALTALRLDDNLSEAHSALGTVKMYWYLDFAGAEREFTRSLELSPRNQGALVFYAYLLQAVRRFDEDIALREREIELDPLSPAVQWGLANAYLTARQDDRGIQQALMVIGMDPMMPEPHIALTRQYALRGEYEKAIAEGRRAVEVSQGGFRFRALAFLGYALATSGRRAEATEILERLKKEDHSGSGFNLVVVYVGLREWDTVFPILDKALEDRSYALRLNTEPIFEPLRSDPRFISLLQRAHFRS